MGKRKRILAINAVLYGSTGRIMRSIVDESRKALGIDYLTFLRIVCFLRFVTKKRTRPEVIVVLAEVTNCFATTRRQKDRSNSI